VFQIRPSVMDFAVVRRWILSDDKHVVGAIAYTQDGREIFFRPQEHRQVKPGVSADVFPVWGKWQQQGVPQTGSIIVFDLHPRGVVGLFYWTTQHEYGRAVSQAVRFAD